MWDRGRCIYIHWVKYFAAPSLSNAIEYKNAQTLFDVLVTLGGTAPFYKHKI